MLVKDVLKRKRDALLANPSFVLYADDCKIIDMGLFENLDRILCMCYRAALLYCIKQSGKSILFMKVHALEWDVESGAITKYSLMDWITTVSTTAPAR